MVKLSRKRQRTPQQVGPFTILRPLGAGGMAETFEGLRRGPGGFEQRACLKRVLPGYEHDSELLQLFLREARLAAALSHRNIVKVLDFGEHLGSPYLALELVHGMDLRALFKTLRPDRVPLDVAVFITMELADALHHAHTREGFTGPVVHRDVSPANTLLSLDGEVKLTDFGISKALKEPLWTPSTAIRGNAWYMAPEQLEGIPVDPRADLYSLGVIFYELIAGTRPYLQGSDFSMLRALAQGNRIPLLEAAPDAPPALAAIVERLLQRSPHERYPDAAALLDALIPHLPSPTNARRTLRDLVRNHEPPPMPAEDTGPITLDLRPASSQRPSSPPASGPQTLSQRMARPSSRPLAQRDPHPSNALFASERPPPSDHEERRRQAEPRSLTTTVTARPKRAAPTQAKTAPPDHAGSDGGAFNEKSEARPPGKTSLLLWGFALSTAAGLALGAYGALALVAG